MTQDPTSYLVQRCTIIYPSLFEPSSYGNEEPKYSASFLIPKSTNMDGIRGAVKTAATQKWGQQILSRMGDLTFPIHNGNKKAVDENGNEDKQNFYYDHYFVRGKSKWQPDVVNAYGDAITDPKEVYGGCIVSVVLRFYGYDYMGKKGVGCGLTAVCKQEDGEPLGGGRVNTSEVFQSVLQEKPQVERVMGGYGEMGDKFPNDEPTYPEDHGTEEPPIHGPIPDQDEDIPF